MDRAGGLLATEGKGILMLSSATVSLKQDDRKALEAFVSDNDDLEQLETLIAEFNIFEAIGAGFLLFGIFVQTQPFPFLDWLTRTPRVSSAASVIGGQVLPTIAAFALASRFEPEIRLAGVFPAFQWLALASAILAAVCGMGQENWKTALPLWISSGFSFAFATLCSSGPVNAFSILIGVALSSSVLAMLASAREAGVSGSRGKSWFKPLVLLSAAPGVGLIGFVSAGGIVRMMTVAAQDPVRAVLFTLALLITQLALWKSIFSILSFKGGSVEKTQAGAPETILPFALSAAVLLLSFGVLWTGTASGGVIPHDPDRLFPSWMGILFGQSATDWGDDSEVVLAQSLVWSCLAVAGLVSYWLFGRGFDLFNRALKNSPRLKRFLQTGYSAGRIGNGLIAGLTSAGHFFELWLSEKLSISWFPTAIETVLNHSSRWVNRTDQKVYTRQESLLRQWVEVPIKTLQLIQNGDLQWYLVFAMGCVVAILIHFLRT